MSISSVRIDAGRVRQDIPAMTDRPAARPAPRASSRRCSWSRGEPVELDAHLARLARSLEAVYAQALPPATREAAAGSGRGHRARAPAPAPSPPRKDGLRQSTSLAPVGSSRRPSSPSAACSLRTHQSPAASAPTSGSTAPGSTARPRRSRRADRRRRRGPGGRLGQRLRRPRRHPLHTPARRPHPPRHHPRRRAGSWRPRKKSRRSEQPLHRRGPATADETFLTGSIRGIEPALASTAQPLPGCGPLSHRLAAALRQRWGLPMTRMRPKLPATEPKLDQLSQ